MRGGSELALLSMASISTARKHSPRPQQRGGGERGTSDCLSDPQPAGLQREVAGGLACCIGFPGRCVGEEDCTVVVEVDDGAAAGADI